MQNSIKHNNHQNILPPVRTKSTEINYVNGTTALSHTHTHCTCRSFIFNIMRIII